MMIVPLPPVLIDLFITLNIASAIDDRGGDAVRAAGARLRRLPVACCC